MITLISPNWVSVWILLEINILSFIPIICASKRNQETEAATKYFLVQALGSLLLLTGAIIGSQPKLYPITVIVLIIALLIKLGAFPCHFWYPSIIASLSWRNCLLLSTWQKIAPLCLLSTIRTKYPSKVLLVFAGINAIIGGFLGINQTHLRSLLAYSSIGHLGWILRIVALNKVIVWVFYFLIYCIAVVPIFILFILTNSKTVYDLYNLHKTHFLIPIIVIIIILSLAGIPPLTGFVPKIIVIRRIIHTNFFILIILLLGSFINLYYYLNIAIASLSALSSGIKSSPIIKIIPLLILMSSAFIGIIFLI